MSASAGSAGPPRLPVGAVPALLLLLGLLLRAPSLALPLLPSDARLSEAAADLAAERWPSLDGEGPLLPALALVPTAMGANPAWVLRLLTLASGAALPVLLHALALRLRVGARTAALAGLLLALHPLCVAHAGGPEAGAQGLALALLLLALLRLSRPVPGPARGAYALLVLAPLAWPAAWPYLATLGLLPLRALEGLRARALWALPAVATLAFALPRGAGEPGGVGPVLAVGLPAASLLTLLPLLPRGLRGLLSGAGPVPLLVGAWCAGALLHGVLLALGALRPGAALALDGARPLLLSSAPCVLVGAVGLAGVGAPWRARWEAGTVLLSLAAALLLGLAPAQAALLGADRAPAGRLSALARALDLAAREAGEHGWVALELGEGAEAQARAARPWAAGRPVVVVPAGSVAGAPGPGWPPGGPPALGLVTVAPLPGEVSTLGGLGLYGQAWVARVGPYAVLRLRRP